MKTKKLLVVNSIHSITSAQIFNNQLERIYSKLKPMINTITPREKFDPVFTNKHTHLLISGSELRASRSYEKDDFFYSLINHFLQAEKPILAICHGHQMLAKSITDSQVCRQASRPEFGWQDIQIESNYLFKGITNPVFMESHFDEVFSLPPSFNIIAHNNNCPIQAFQYRNNACWGLQFHPEVNLQESEIMLKQISRNYPELETNINWKMPKSGLIFQNYKIFENFLNAG